MDDDDPVINSLLLADELGRQLEGQGGNDDNDNGGGGGGNDDPVNIVNTRTVTETYVGSFEDFYISGSGYITPPEIGGDRVNGPGQLNQLMIESPTENFSVEIVTDGSEIINENFSDLARWSDVITDMDAFEKDGNYLFSAQEYSFDGWMSIRVRVPEETTFPAIRTEVDVEKQVETQ